ncbi:hypothetical protein ACOME3_008157 [Neoechinorhynchus agilis]
MDAFIRAVDDKDESMEREIVSNQEDDHNTTETCPLFDKMSKEDHCDENKDHEIDKDIQILPPKPPPSFTHDKTLNSMLMSWYMCGYHTGYYMALRDHGTLKIFQNEEDDKDAT